MNAEHTHQVFDWLWCSGQISADDIAAMPGLGIQAVINLALPTSSPNLPGEAELVTGQGITYVHIPVPWEQPNRQHLHVFFGTLKAFEGQSVWVHCARNMRASAFIYLYRRLVLGEPHPTAQHPMLEVWEPNDTWGAFIRETLGASN